MGMRIGSIMLAALGAACGGDIGAGIDDPDAAARAFDAAPPDAALDAPPPVAACDDGVARFSDPSSGNCYFRFDTLEARDVARARCEALGAHLATITSAAEDAAVAMVAPVGGTLPAETDAWIGGNDLAAEGTFVWDTGEPFVFDNFRDGEPNNNNPNDPAGEDCQVYEGDLLTWDDRSCSLGLFVFICEREP